MARRRRRAARGLARENEASTRRHAPIKRLSKTPSAAIVGLGAVGGMVAANRLEPIAFYPMGRRVPASALGIAAAIGVALVAHHYERKLTGKGARTARRVAEGAAGVGGGLLLGVIYEAIARRQGKG